MINKCSLVTWVTITVLMAVGTSLRARAGEGAAAPAAEPPKALPQRATVAVFPLGGDAKPELRDRCGFALRAKLDRTEKFEVIDGPRMADLAGEEGVDFSTPAESVKKLAGEVTADVLIWGEMKNGPGGTAMRLHVLDLRQKNPAERDLEKVVAQPQDLRFVTEQVLETIAGVDKFEHPSEEAVTADADAETLWKKNPNLAKNGDFGDSGGWTAIYMAEKYAAPVGDALPAEDKVAIVRLKEDGQANNALAMRLSRTCAENNGLACLSDPIKIEPDTRYRLSFRYKSDGPRLHVFVKGYTMEKNLKGELVEREIYRRQVPPSGGTDGKWVTVVDDLNPQHVAFPVQHLRIDLYAYLSPGQVMFDDVTLKAVGRQTRNARDNAIDKPITRPSRQDKGPRQ